MTDIIPFIGRVDAREREGWIDALNTAMPRRRIAAVAELSAEERQSVEVALVADPDPSDLQSLPNLKWIQSLWAGVERLVAEISDPAIRIVRMTDPQMAATMSEAVLAWTLYLHRDMPLYRRQQNELLWRQHDVLMPSARRIGILGLGKMGAAAAVRLAENGFSVSGWSRRGGDVSGIEVYSGADGLRDMLSRSGILIILLPLTAETHGLVNKEMLELLPPGASVINFARGQLVVEQDLLKCLDDGHLDHAVLDVFDEEPLARNHPFWSHPKITVLPHISAPTNKATASGIAAQNIEAFFRGGLIPKFVDRSRGY